MQYFSICKLINVMSHCDRDKTIQSCPWIQEKVVDKVGFFFCLILHSLGFCFSLLILCCRLRLLIFFFFLWRVCVCFFCFFVFCLCLLKQEIKEITVKTRAKEEDVKLGGWGGEDLDGARGGETWWEYTTWKIFLIIKKYSKERKKIIDTIVSEISQTEKEWSH